MCVFKDCNLNVITCTFILFIFFKSIGLFSFPFSKMLPTTSLNSLDHDNGSLNSREAARHTAGFKRYKYLRRLLHFRHMDFEFALWQMLYLFTSPQKVYRNFHYRKQTKDQWARDDPAFLVLLSIWLCGECLRNLLNTVQGIVDQSWACSRKIHHLYCCSFFCVKPMLISFHSVGNMYSYTFPLAPHP